MNVLDIENWMAWYAKASMPKRSIYGNDWIDLANVGNSYDPNYAYC